MVDTYHLLLMRNFVGAHPQLRAVDKCRLAALQVENEIMVI